MASKKVPKRPKKGYFGDVRWTFNTRVRTTLVAWMRKLRARIWVVAPLVAMAFGVDRDPLLLATIVLMITLLSVIVQIVVESATDQDDSGTDPPASAGSGTCNSSKKE